MKSNMLLVTVLLFVVSAYAIKWKTYDVYDVSFKTEEMLTKFSQVTGSKSLKTSKLALLKSSVTVTEVLQLLRLTKDNLEFIHQERSRLDECKDVTEEWFNMLRAVIESKPGVIRDRARAKASNLRAMEMKAARSGKSQSKINSFLHRMKTWFNLPL